jgi:outer membrane protein assembly factor BamD
MAARTPTIRSFFPSTRAARFAGIAVAALLTVSIGAYAQTAGQAAPAADQTQSAPAQPTPPVTLSNTPPTKKRKQDDKVIVSKDTKKEDKKVKKDNPLEGVKASNPDKALYDKAQDAIKHGRYDVARLDLQTLLNTYPDSEFLMRSKLAIADSWFKEGGTAALTQAEQEYKDFITFFPNAPEAAEAQMRVGDIYFKQMDKPDRDNKYAVAAEREYRLMLQQFPESTLVPEATQRLREVQEVLATAQASVGDYYQTRQNFYAVVARYQTVADTYPLYSHIDQVLIGLGDAYSAQSRFVRTLNLPEAGKARLEKIYDDQAANAYRKVILEHSAMPHVEDAKDRLAAMNLPVPTPTAEQIAASTAVENSRAQYHIGDVISLMFLHKPDTVQAATITAPSLEDPKATYAPEMVHRAEKDFAIALNPPLSSAPPPTPNAPAPSNTPAPTPVANAPAAPLSFQDVPTAGGGAPVNTNVQVGPASRGSSGSSIGVEIVQPGSSPAPAQTPEAAPAVTPAPAVAPPPPAAQVDTTGGIKPVGPKDATPLPPVEKAGSAPTPINDVTPGSQSAAQTADGKTKAPDYDKKSESDSKHKKKKGLAVLNPF